MAPVDLNKNRESLVKAHKEVSDPNSPTDWAVFGYEGQSDVLKVVSKGDGGVSEWLDELNTGRILYSYLRITDPNSNLPKFVFVNWQGEGVPENRKGACANHLRDVQHLLRGAHISINARTEDDVDEDTIKSKVSSASGANYGFHKEERKPIPAPEPVGSVYQKIKPQIEIKPQIREKFWEETAKDDKKRQAEEVQRKQTERSKYEQEIKEREIKATQEREKREADRFKKIQEIKAAEKKANAPSSADPSKWEKEQESARTDADERSKRSEQMRKERAAEAKMLVSQRSSDARAAFEQRPTSQFDAPSKAPPPSRKLKTGFLDEANQQQEPEKRKQPIVLPKAEEPEDVYDDTSAAPGGGYGGQDDIYDDTSAASPPPVPAEVPKTRNLLAEGLPKRQDSDEEQEEEQDWDGGHKADVSQRAPPLEDFGMPGQRASASEELYEDTTVPAAHHFEQAEELYDDASGIQQHKGQNARALYDYQAAEENEITFDPGDLITDLDMIDEGWWVGTGPDGKRGMFPSNYVELIE